ncbi:MAG: T9SS type A sorting domain-containing protein, partial [Paludibacteraceae bacterium]|nr:T9SS type A sorting domain-containing protein [Paludibacteraceae bacterium]
TILPGVILDDNVRDPEAKTYEIEIPNLAKYSCLNLKFQLTDKDDVSHVYTEQEVQVPILVKDEHTTVDQIFNSIVKTDGGDPLYDESIQRCQTCDVVVLGGGLLTKATDGTTHDAPEIGNLKVYPGGKVVVPEGTTYTVNSLALRRQEDALSLAQVEGTLAIKQPNSTFLDIRIDPSNWHYFTLPYDVNVSDITFVDGTPAAIGTDFRIGTYDGEHRAATQSASWVYLNSEDVLKAGLGYIIGLPGSGKVQRELRFPMANEVITAEKTDKVIAGFHAWGGDKSDEELRPNHKGWNLIGAPYLTYYETELTTPLPTGKLVEDTSEDPWQGHYVRNDDGLRYIVVPQDNGWSEYKQVAIANYHMAPFTSYFVQIGGSDPAADQTISYTASQAGKLSIVRRAVQEEVEDNHEVWFGVELVNADGLKDETALLISDKFTDDYDIMDDLVKMRGQYYQYAQITTKPVLASRNLKGEMAFNALPDSTAAAGVPLNFFAAKDGDYRFTISGNYPLGEVKSAYLYDNDNATQKWHNLMESDYTFTTKRGDNTTRFMLAVTVERKQPEITTALDNMSSKLTLTTINRTLVLSGLTSESDIYVYDVSGKLLSTGQYNASASGVFRTTVENAGVYFVRVCSKDGQQTLQTIVY